MSAETNHWITEELGAPSQESLEEVQAEGVRRQLDHELRADPGVPLHISDRAELLGVTNPLAHYYLRPRHDKGGRPQVYTQPLFLDDFPYRSLRRWTLVYHTNPAKNVYERSVQDWATDPSDQHEGAWIIPSHVSARRTPDTAPVFDRLAPQRIQFNFGSRYEQEMRQFFALLIQNEEPDVGAFMDATRPFIGGEVVELHPGTDVAHASYSPVPHVNQ